MKLENASRKITLAQIKENNTMLIMRFMDYNLVLFHYSGLFPLTPNRTVLDCIENNTIHIAHSCSETKSKLFKHSIYIGLGVTLWSSHNRKQL